MFLVIFETDEQIEQHFPGLIFFEVRCGWELAFLEEQMILQCLVYFFFKNHFFLFFLDIQYFRGYFKEHYVFQYVFNIFFCHIKLVECLIMIGDLINFVDTLIEFHKSGVRLSIDDCEGRVYFWFRLRDYFVVFVDVDFSKHLIQIITKLYFGR